MEPDFKADYRAEQSLFTLDPDIAEDNLAAIRGMVQDLSLLMGRVRRHLPGLKAAERREAHLAMEQILGDLLLEEWNDNLEAAGSTEPFPSFLDKPFRPQPTRGSSPTNPATFSMEAL